MAGSDEELIQAALKRRSAYGAVYRAYRDRIFRYFWYRLDHHEALADDLTQETFLKAFAALPRFRPRSRYLTYLLTIAHNVLTSHFRKRTTLPLEAAERIPDDPTERLTDRLDGQMLWRLVKRLPVIEQDALLLKYQDDLSTRDIARILGRTENAVKLLLTRARRRLRMVSHLRRQLARPTTKPATGRRQPTSTWGFPAR